jgi:hypothetical protein
LTDRDNGSEKSRFGDFSNIISPITKNEKFHFPLKIREDPSIPLSKRSNVNNKTEVSNDPFQEILGGPNQITESRISLRRA